MTQQSRKPIARRRPGVKAGIEYRLTKLVAKVVKWRDGWMCQVCSQRLRDGEAHAHHVENKSRGKVLRWVLMNLLTVCQADHEWAHRHPADFEAWFAAKFPDRWEYIQQHKNEIRRFTEDELLEMERVTQDELSRLGGDAWKV